VIIGVPKETLAGERRVALVPDAVKQIAGDGIEVRVETQAGAAAGFRPGSFRRRTATFGAW